MTANEANPADETMTRDTLKQDLVRINQKISGLIATARTLPGISDDLFSDLEKTNNHISKRLLEETVRVAAVGAIKSGKSTFVNTLLKGDHLKRGAGVVTSIVTRIKSGDGLRAHLYFKSWDEVNEEIESALILFPAGELPTDEKGFDIRRQNDRSALQSALQTLGAEQLISRDTRSVNSVLLFSYIKGYDRVKDIVGSETTHREFAAEQFATHRDFVGNDALSVYLRDIRLEIDGTDLGSHLELADCQGSDSPNPLHLSMIQDYLLNTHMIVYVISSRTGVRQADIRFLSIIKKMGIMENILFVINCDFSEHDTPSDLQKIITRVKEEISLLVTDPQIFSFSSLYHLFMSRESGLSPKDNARLEQWKAERQFIDFSNGELKRFKAEFRRIIIEERTELLLRNHLERLAVICSEMDQWVQLSKKMIQEDAEDVREIAEKIEQHKARMNQMSSIIQSTLDGAVRKIKQTLRNDIDGFFDPRSGALVNRLTSFIRAFNVDYTDYISQAKAIGFAGTLYLLFQDFKQAVDAFLAETINPEVVNFIKTLEKKMAGELESVTAPYDEMAAEALGRHNKAMSDLGIRQLGNPAPPSRGYDPDELKRVAGLSLPPAKAMMRYSAHVKTEAVLRLGVYSIARIFKKLFKKPVATAHQDVVMALQDGVTRMKRETEKSLIAHFRDYKENVKFQYVMKMADALSRTLKDRLMERFQISVTEMTELRDRIGERQSDKAQAREILDGMREGIEHVDAEISQVRSTLSGGR